MSPPQLPEGEGCFARVRTEAELEHNFETSTQPSTTAADRRVRERHAAGSERVWREIGAAVATVTKPEQIRGARRLSKAESITNDGFQPPTRAATPGAATAFFVGKSPA